MELDPKLTLIVADNGVGKTAVLDGISYCLSRILSRIPGLSGENLKQEDIRLERADVQAPFCSIQVEAASGLVWSRSQKRDSTEVTSQHVPPLPGDKHLVEYLDPLITRVTVGEEETLPVFAFYRAQRAVDIPRRRRAFKKSFKRFDGLASALDPSTSFKQFFEWFYAQERDHFEHVFNVVVNQFGSKTEAAKEGQIAAALQRELDGPTGRLLRAIREAISVAVPGYKNPRIKTNPLRMVLTRNRADQVEEELSLQMLSDGYRTMLVMVMDFARRLAQTNPHLENPLAAEAIMLVDEIDLHLHPRWQQTVIPSLIQAFPNTQFILTTHSPQVVTTAKRQNVRMLAMADDGAGFALLPEREIKAMESAVALNDVLGVNPVPPSLEATWLNEYLAMIEGGNHRSPDAVSLRQKLVAVYGVGHPLLLDCDRLIRFQDFKLQKNGKV